MYTIAINEKKDSGFRMGIKKGKKNMNLFERE